MEVIPHLRHRDAVRPFALLAALALALSLALPAAGQPTLVPDAGTLFVLNVDAASGRLQDLTGRYQAEVTGGEMMKDETGRSCIRFGPGGKSGISIKDDGKLAFEGGMVLEAWVYFEEPLPAKAATLALKAGSFCWDVAKGKLNTTWLVFPSEEIFITAPQQFKYYPVGGDTINGFMNIPVKKWVKLTMAYDEALGAVITSIDGMTDRRRYRYRGAQRLQSDGRSPLTLLPGFTNCRVSAVTLRSGRPRLNVSAMEAYANALPYEEKVLLTLDHIDPALPLPLEVTVVWEKASGSAETLHTVTLNSHAKHDILLDAPTWKNSLHTYAVHVTTRGHEIFSRNLRVANVKPAGPTLIHADHTISRDGKKFFPLMVYHAVPEDFPKLAELGFNIIYNDFNLGREAPKDKAAYDALLTTSLDAAQKSGLYLITATNSTFNKLHTIPVARPHPAMLLWYGADEPWGDLTRLAESYNTIKMLEPDLPVLIIQNNYSRLQDTAPGADILATDPYPVPNVSLRAVVDATESSLRAVSGRKPVWTIIPQYAGKIPTREELRCMAWLALASGAHGLGFFDWDERTRDAASGGLKGWYTKEHPDQVEDLRVVVAELRAHEALLLMPRATEQVTMTAPGNPALHALVKEESPGGRRYLILANDSRRAETALMEFPFKGVADAEVKPLKGSALASAPGLSVRNGKARVELPPLGVGVYE
ncbi:MAG TPA: hypothetical protein VLE43_02915, partial [Candidatus Saccharimonadia bacterium]|nr:hypothetical protein [Candidatus Saccharimonadia bacterium]